MDEWIQRDTHVETRTPNDANPTTLISTCAAETYTSMVLKSKYSGDVTIRSSLEFTDRMPPLIVVAA